MAIAIIISSIIDPEKRYKRVLSYRNGIISQVAHRSEAGSRMNGGRISGSCAQHWKRFSDKVIAVTGGGTGIRQQNAKDLNSEGAVVHIMGRREDRLKDAKGIIAPDGSNSFSINAMSRIMLRSMRSSCK